MKKTKPKPVSTQPPCVLVTCNDAIGPALLEMEDVGGHRLHLTFRRKSQNLAAFAITRGEAKRIIAWLNAYS